MSRINYIPEYENFFKTVKFSINKYGKNNSITAFSHFADLLNFPQNNNSSSNFGKLLSPGTDKDLKVRELLLVLEELDHEKKYILDSMCKMFDYICIPAVDKKPIVSFEKFFIDVSLISGKIAEKFQEFNKDNTIDNFESQELNSLMYDFRVLIRSYEFEVIE